MSAFQVRPTRSTSAGSNSAVSSSQRSDQGEAENELTKDQLKSAPDFESISPRTHDRPAGVVADTGMAPRPASPGAER